MFKKHMKAALMFAAVLAFAGAAQAGILPPDFGLASIDPMMGVALAGVGNIDLVLKQMESIENSMGEFQKKAKADIEANGKVAHDTNTALNKLGEQQREVADRLLALEQSGGGNDGDNTVISMGKQFTDSDAYTNFAGGNAQKARFEVQNSTLTGGDATVAPDRKPGIVGGAIQPLTLEDLIIGLPTTSNAIEYTKETTFTNNAAEAAEGAAKAETDVAFTLANMPISTVAHWTKISRQLAADAPALAAYINLRMAYGVDQRVELQLGAGDGVAPNLSGLLDTGNYTAHGIANAALGSVLKKLVLIRKIIATAWNAGYPADAILLNPIDFGQIEIDLLTETAGQARVNVNAAGQPMLFGVPVVQSIGVTQDSFLVGSFQQAATIHNREGVVVELSESDSDNFTKNLITVRAERRLALTVEKPAALIGGDLTPV